MTARNPLVTLAAAILCFFALDALVFRSGLYARISSLVSIQGVATRVVQFEKDRNPSGQKEILVLGNSKEDYGLFRFQDRLNSGPYRFIQGSAGGAHERAWYFFARAMDPHRDRYAAIVVPPQSYRVASGSIDQWSNVQDVWETSPEMSLSDWVIAVKKATDPDARRKLVNLALFASRQYSQDVADLLRHPFDRFQRKAQVDALQGQWRASTTRLTPDGNVDWTVFEPWHTIAEFKRDPATNQILQCPAHMPRNLCEQYNSAFQGFDGASAERFMRRNADYSIYWLKKLLALYAGSPTRIIFAQVPRWPTDLPNEPVVDDAVDLQPIFDAVPNVTFIPASTFVDFEKPENFLDADHLAPEAASRFANRFRDAVTAAVEAPKQAQASDGGETLAGGK